MKIKGKIIRIFFKKENFSSSLVEILSPVKKINIDGQSVPSTCVFSGYYFPKKIHEELMFNGDFMIDPKYGLQFKVLAAMPPLDSVENIESYLSSPFVKGIGKKTAHSIVQMYGINSIEKIKEGGDDILSIKGITPSRLEEMQKSIMASSIYMDIIEFFHGLASVSQIEKIYEKYGDKALEKLKKNPYCLITDIQGFAFKTVDALAMKANIEKSDPRRVEAAVVFTLQTLASNGHCYCDVNNIFTEVNALFNDLEVSEDTLAECIGNLVMQKSVYLDDYRLYWQEYYNAETFIADKTKEMLQKKRKDIPFPKILESISAFEKEVGFTLEEQQKNAIVMAVNNNLSCITGGAGTGKSTIIKGIISVVSKHTSQEIILAAPTGKASRRMADLTGLSASTIHRLIMRNEPLSDSFVILDEMSMADIHLFKDIFKLIGKNTQLCLLGDINQLPPVGAGLVFKDFLNCKLIPKTVLNISHRCTGSIALNADKINNGNTCQSWIMDHQFILYKSSKEDLQRNVIGLYLTLLKKYDIKDIQLIVPMKSRGTTSTNVLNDIIRDHLNPLPPGAEKDKTKFRVGDRVMITKNNSVLEINNGDSGTIKEIDFDENITNVELDDGRNVELDAEDVKNLQLSYAITCHKAQGQEYKCVVLAQSSEHYVMLQRNFLYTAVTRAKEKLVLVGDVKSINMAVRNTKPVKRATYLLQRLYLNR